MRQLQSIHSSDAPTASTKAAASDAVRQALDLLGRASADWQNGMDAVPGPLHWPVAIHHARKHLQDALKALDGADLEDALRGSIWWNSITPAERRRWLEAASSAVPADAWRAFQAGGSQP